MSIFVLPSDSAERKEWPVGRFLRGYFPNAVAYLAHLSWVANEQHNPGEPMHWARGKSADHVDCEVRHLLAGSTVDDDGLLHVGKKAWRAMADLEEELEKMRDVGVTQFGARQSKTRQQAADTEGGSVVECYCECDDCLTWRLNQCECAEGTHELGCAYFEEQTPESFNLPGHTPKGALPAWAKAMQVRFQ